MYIKRLEDGNLILYKEDVNNSYVIISDGSILKYTGIYYVKNTNSLGHFEIETRFVGKVDTYKFNHENGYEGIFIIPLFIYNELTNEWKKIINYSPPKYGNKYFYYPHLLMLPVFHSNHYPLYYLDTCVNVELSKYEDTNATFEL
jgi:hypothetical protein